MHPHNYLSHGQLKISVSRKLQAEDRVVFDPGRQQVHGCVSQCLAAIIRRHHKESNVLTIHNFMHSHKFGVALLV
jgi:hypothetical protein